MKDVRITRSEVIRSNTGDVGESIYCLEIADYFTVEELIEVSNYLRTLCQEERISRMEKGGER